jgi:hypothetical protein
MKSGSTDYYQEIGFDKVTLDQVCFLRSNRSRQNLNDEILSFKEKRLILRSVDCSIQK